MIVLFSLITVLMIWFFSYQFETLSTGQKPSIPSDLEYVFGGNADIEVPEKLLLVNFWATWCAPCLQELPILVKIANQYRDKVQFLGLAVDSPRENIVALQQQFQIPYALAIAPWVMVSAWRAEQLPVSYLLSSSGEIIWSHRGAVSEVELIDAIKNATSN